VQSWIEQLTSLPVGSAPYDPGMSISGEGALALDSRAGRRVLAATVLGSGMASLDATVVNVALPTIGRELDGGIAALQWIINGYTLTLAAFLLLGGALGDRYGRRRTFLVGVVWFTAASMACALAPSTRTLTVARVLQGVGGALLTPGSLAILGASFRIADRAAAIGAWSGLGGVAIAIGPLVGGWLIQAASWRLVFFINLPLALAVVVLSRFVPETRDPDAGPVDAAGAALAALALGGVTFALIEAGARGWRAPAVVVAFVVGLGALAAFFAVEARRAAPMLALFRRRPFGAANAETLLVYAAVGGALLFLPIQLQLVRGYPPLAAGAALLPTTAVLLLLSSTMGRVAQRIGPRAPMTLGPLVAAIGLLLLARIDRESSYASAVLPGALVLGLGLSATVAPLTATVLAAAPPHQTGLASAVNNAVARTGSLLAVALLPTLVGIRDAAHFAAGYPRAMQLAAAGCACGALIALLRVRTPGGFERAATHTGCPLDAPTLRGGATGR
jgi:EmrB/QacA subfamily drug resistance transporter